MTKIITSFPIDKQLQLSISFSAAEDKLLLSGVRYCQNERESINSEPNHDSFIQKIKNELECYLSDASFQFSLPCNFQLGTLFQQKVWQALTEIPSGEVKTYGALAKELDTSARAVGNACRRNLFPVIIPCHRVVSASGVGGYAGDTLDVQKGDINFLRIKQWLLAHEAALYEKRKG